MKIKILVILLVSSLLACEKSSVNKGAVPDKNVSESFMPLQIGNYWNFNKENYSIVSDTVRIKGNLYYKISSLTGGDVGGEDYYRIDENNNLLSGSITNPDFTYLIAKFNANVGDTFQTIGDQTVNDFLATVTEKTDTKIVFTYTRVYHPNLAGQTHTRTFIKGLGWDTGAKTVRINGVVYTK
jgi:hypothetical protein